MKWFQEPGSHTGEPPQREDEGRSDHGEFRLPWDGKRPSLPPVLGEIWQRAKEPAQKVDLPWLLEKVPYFEDLPEKPPVRSHRPGRGNPLDNQVVAWQQTLLHVLRLLAEVYLSSRSLAPEVRLLHAQGWQVLAELYHQLLEYRNSVPGLSRAQGSDNVLFNNLKLVTSVFNNKKEQREQSFMPPGNLVAGLGAYSFRPYLLSDQGKGAKGPRTTFKGGYGSQNTPKSYGSFGKGRGGLCASTSYGSYKWQASGRGRGKGEPSSPSNLFTFSLLQKAPRQNSLVEKECKPRSGQQHTVWHSPRVVLPLSAPPVHSENYSRTVRMFKPLVRLLAVGGCERGNPPRGKVPSPLVSHQKTRGGVPK